MTTLFTGSYDQLINFIFRIYDCDTDKIITKEDVKLIMSYLPLKHNKLNTLSFKMERDGFGDRKESQDEISKYLAVLFKDNESIEEHEFKKIITEQVSEPFIYVN